MLNSLISSVQKIENDQALYNLCYLIYICSIVERSTVEQLECVFDIENEWSLSFLKSKVSMRDIQMFMSYLLTINKNRQRKLEENWLQVLTDDFLLTGYFHKGYICKTITQFETPFSFPNKTNYIYSFKVIAKLCLIRKHLEVNRTIFDILNSYRDRFVHRFIKRYVIIDGIVQDIVFTDYAQRVLIAKLKSRDPYTKFGDWLMSLTGPTLHMDKKYKYEGMSHAGRELKKMYLVGHRKKARKMRGYIIKQYVKGCRIKVLKEQFKMSAERIILLSASAIRRKSMIDKIMYISPDTSRFYYSCLADFQLYPTGTNWTNSSKIRQYTGLQLHKEHGPLL